MTAHEWFAGEERAAVDTALEFDTIYAAVMAEAEAAAEQGTDLGPVELQAELALLMFQERLRLRQAAGLTELTPEDHDRLAKLDFMLTTSERDDDGETEGQMADRLARDENPGLPE